MTVIFLKKKLTYRDGISLNILSAITKSGKTTKLLNSQSLLHFQNPHYSDYIYIYLSSRSQTRFPTHKNFVKVSPISPRNIFTATFQRVAVFGESPPCSKLILLYIHIPVGPYAKRTRFRVPRFRPVVCTRCVRLDKRSATNLAVDLVANCTVGGARVKFLVVLGAVGTNFADFPKKN